MFQRDDHGSSTTHAGCVTCMRLVCKFVGLCYADIGISFLRDVRLNTRRGRDRPEPKAIKCVKATQGYIQTPQIWSKIMLCGRVPRLDQVTYRHTDTHAIFSCFRLCLYLSSVRTTGAPQNHWFGPGADCRAAGIGTREAIRAVWSCHR